MRFEAKGEPTFVAICHCADCRRAAGAPFVHWVGFERTAVGFTSEPRLRPGARRVTRGFCDGCGTTLSYADADLPLDEVYLSGGAFDDPVAVPPTRHAYWSERLAFVALADDLPKFEGFSRQRVGGPEPERVA
ncbi:GFA family protein [Acuticoccus sp.]|uniref:GFA family protein n=1 Tax=Acuticoccus sp. TaxID=1904378 RepID=UPI003B5247C3